MADNGLDDRQVIGLAFDGNGYGSDGAVWGGEVLLASYTDFQRFAHLEYVPLPASDPVFRSPWRLAAGYARALGIQVEDLPFLQNIDRKALRLLRQQADRRQNAPLTSSMGKLFDAAASLMGIRNEITYETQAALEMEVLSRRFLTNAGSYPYVIEELNGDRLIRLKQLFSSIVHDIRAGESVGSIGARFHKTIAEAAIEVCRMARRSTGINAVALSGGVWQNQILLELVREGLSSQEFTVYFHKQVPTNDGGLALGQVMVANHVIARGQTVPAANERRGNAQ
jgi:hydrogenase maturation protein HypF